MVIERNADPALLEILRRVLDPEVPAINIVDLGIVRSIGLTPEGVVAVEITPTYSGCPAMRVIEEDITAALQAEGYERAEIRTVFSPAWTTDWLSDEAKAMLRAYGIAPPGGVSREPELVPLTASVSRVQCPFCGSENTERKSQFGSTACKALHYCRGCHQPFEEFKAI